MRNLTMMTDLYELTMMYGYFKSGTDKRVATFDMFYRKNCPSTDYAIMAGVEQLVEYIENLRFSDEDIDYLRSLRLFDEDFLKHLRAFCFAGEIDCVSEGTIVFPGEPLIRVTAPIGQAQLIEAALLNIINHQTLIATKAHRVVMAAAGDPVMEFGLRRAHGPDAGIYGARAAMVGGCVGTSNVLTGKLFDVPVKGTHAHSWVMSFPDELSAFRAYAEYFPDSCMLLVDTFDTLKSGVPNAITVFRELRAKGYKPVGIRLDSGDLAYLSREARKMLDSAGFPDACICASNDLDENIIRDLKLQGAKITLWGVGTRLITSADCPALGGVYKLSAEQTENGIVPKIKISDNPEKCTLPGVKQLYRIYGPDGMAIADLIALADETFDPRLPLTIYDPMAPWKRMTLRDYRMQPLLKPLIRNGKRTHPLPTLDEISAHRRNEIASFWEQYLRLLNPHPYKVDWSDALFNLRKNLLYRAADRRT